MAAQRVAGQCSFLCIKYDTCRQAVVISQQQSPSTMLCLNKWEIMICQNRELFGRFTCREYDVKYNRRILIRIVSRGLNALLKGNSLGIALYHLGRRSNFVSLFLSGFILPLHLSVISPFLSCSLPLFLPSFLFLKFSLDCLCQELLNYGPWVKSGQPPASVNKVLVNNGLISFSYCL